jgi:hypothetical protein
MENGRKVASEIGWQRTARPGYWRTQSLLIMASALAACALAITQDNRQLNARAGATGTLTLRPKISGHCQLLPT